jgi:hypothetical protein
MTPRNHLSEAARIPQKRSSAFFIKLPRSTGSIATQFQSNLELLVQRMMANDMRQEEPKAHYLAVKHRRCQYARAGRLFEAGKQINEWTQEYNKQDAAIAQALEAGLISNVTQGKEAVDIYWSEMARRARED